MQHSKCRCRRISQDEEAELIEEASIVEEEEVPSLDRTPYYERYDVLQSLIAYNLMKSYVLQKKLTHFFKRRKMDHVFQEDPRPIGTVSKYHMKLDAYRELLEFSRTQRERVTAELVDLRDRSRSMKQTLDTLFKDMQRREFEIGHGLINTKTGNEIPDKLIEKYLKRQRDALREVSTMLLKFLRLKYMVQEKVDAIAALDEVAPGMFLTDYEQLKLENRIHVDKLEEKDEILVRLRSKCHSTIQMLAHLRDKGAEMDIDLEDLTFDKTALKVEQTEIREMVNKLKGQRDIYRQKSNIIREESGLLTHATLLRDMEASQIEFKEATETLENLLESHKTKAKLVRNLRLHIESIQGGDLFSRSRDDISDTRGSRIRSRARKSTRLSEGLKSKANAANKSEISLRRKSTMRAGSTVVDPFLLACRSRSSILTVDEAQLRSIVNHL